MKRTLIAMLAGTALVAAGAYAGGDKAQHSQNETSPSASSSSSAESQSPQSSASTQSSQSSASEQSSAPSASSSASQGSQQASSQDSETVKAVQGALASQGYDPGPIDGKLGNRTKGALKQAQKDKGVTESGQIDQQTLAALGVGETGSSSASSSMSSGGTSGSASTSGG